MLLVNRQLGKKIEVLLAAVDGDDQELRMKWSTEVVEFRSATLLLLLLNSSSAV